MRYKLKRGRWIIAGMFLVLIGVIIYRGYISYNEKCHVEELQKKREEVKGYDGRIVANSKILFAIEKNGSVKSCQVREEAEADTAYQKVDDLKDIRAIDTYGQDTFLLREDGTVVVRCNKEDKYQEVESTWSNIKEISCGNGYVLGLKTDGTVVSAVSSSCAGKREYEFLDTSKLRDISSIYAGSTGAAFVTKEGKVLIQSDVSTFSSYKKWSNIVEAKIDLGVLVGLKEDGTVVMETIYDNISPDCAEINRWKDIISIGVLDGDSERSPFIIGLKEDGEVVSTGVFAPDLSKVHNVAAFDLKDYNIAFLMKDGSVSYYPTLFYENDMLVSRDYEKWRIK